MPKKYPKGIHVSLWVSGFINIVIYQYHHPEGRKGEMQQKVKGSFEWKAAVKFYIRKRYVVRIYFSASFQLASAEEDIKMVSNIVHSKESSLF